MDLINVRKMEHIKIHSFPFVLIKLHRWWEINSQSRYGAWDSFLLKLSVLVWHSFETFLNQAVRAVQCCHILHFNQAKWVVRKTLDAWKHLWVRLFITWPDWYLPKSGRLQLADPTLSHSIITRGCWQVLSPTIRKQATATKLGIYSTYSPRSSRHFLARCRNFCKPLKKNSEGCPRPTRSPQQQWPPRRTKNCDLSIVFFSPGNRW
jgi:hypothetical protein